MRLWAIGMVSNCLKLGSGVIQGRRNIGLVCESSGKGVAGGIGSGWIGLHVKDRLTGKLIATFRN